MGCRALASGVILAGWRGNMLIAIECIHFVQPVSKTVFYTYLFVCAYYIAYYIDSVQLLVFLTKS